MVQIFVSRMKINEKSMKINITFRAGVVDGVVAFGVVRRWRDGFDDVLVITCNLERSVWKDVSYFLELFYSILFVF